MVGIGSDFAVGDHVQIAPVGVAGGDGHELVVVGPVEDADLQVSPTDNWNEVAAVARNT